MKCRRTAGKAATSAVRAGGTIEVFFDASGDVGLRAAAFRQLAHKIQQLLCCRPRLGLRQRGPKLRNYFVAHGDFDPRSDVFSNPANQLGQTLARFADRQLHEGEFTKGRITSQSQDVHGFQTV
jgi:hypothetical protein